MKRHFKSLYLKSLLFIAICIAISQTTFAQAPNIILGRPTDTSITASIMFNQAMVYYFEYGIASATYTHQTNQFTSTANVPDEVDFKNLLPNTKYYYRVQYRAVTSGGGFTPSSEYSFRTQRTPGSTFTFTVEADEHLYDKKGVKNMYNVTLGNEAADKPDFMLSLGDIFGDDHYPFTITSGGLDSLHRDYRPFLGSICHSIPFYICLGTHEGENDYYQSFNAPNNLCDWATQWRKYYYPNPYPNGFYTGNTTNEPFGIGTPENYYAWTWGDALFVVLDVYRTECHDSLVPKPQNWNWTLGLNQYTWLKSTLENSTAKFKFVFAHHLRGQGRGGVALATVNEWGGYQNTTSGQYTFPTYRPGWAKPIHQLFKDTKVTMFIQGHDHVFAHEVLDSITYISTPMAADSTYEIGMLANAAAYVSDTVDGTGHLRFTVSSTCVKMDYVKAYLPKDTLGIHKNREIGFSVTLGTCAVQPNGINTLTQHDEINIYPNPSNSSFTISKSGSDKMNVVELTTVMGQVILRKEMVQNLIEVNTSVMPDGIYFVNIETATNKVVKKLVVNH